MSWISKLYATYENCESLVGKKEADDKTPLLPICHSTQNAQIEVTVDVHGNLKYACTIDKKDAVTIIPVTEDSASRSSGVAPHPLFDKLQYLSGDYAKFVDSKKGGEFFEKYIKELEGWCSSPYRNKKVCAIFSYLEKGTLISDLIGQKVLQCGEDGKLITDVKLDASSQCDAFVRFRVNVEGDREPRVWLDKEVWSSYIKYYLSQQKDRELCYAQGEVMPCSEKHPSKIRNTGDKAKLISANDSEGYTYRGRFVNKSQAISVGYETSQKAHNALKWLIDKQGYKNYEQVIVAWGTKNQSIPSFFEDAVSFFPKEELSLLPSTSEQFAKRLNTAIAGYKYDLEDNAEIVVMGLDSATTGRLSITYYRELNGIELLERIQKWHDTCQWRHTYKSIIEGTDEKGKPKFKRIFFIGAPAPKDIANAAYGPRPNDKLVKATVERLLPCIIDGAGIPYDIVAAITNRAIRPLSMENVYEWEKVRSIACALIKKYRNDRFKEVWSMELDKGVTDHHYLCGRLLAVADEIEGWALREMNEKRETNAIRLFERFAQNPAKTWGVIAKRVNPYEIKLGKMDKSCKWLLEIREDISQKIDPDDFKKIKNLDGRFVLGFDCQKKEIRDEINRRKEARLNSKKAGPETNNDEGGKIE